MFLCIPLVYGCPAKLTQEGHDEIICPKCHNRGANKYKQKKWFEFCYVPLIPLGTKHLYVCPICNWRAPVDKVNVSELPGGTSGKGPQNYGGHHVQQQPQGNGYNVGYTGAPK